MCSTGDLGSCAVWVNTFRTARKRHECDACAATIEPRSPYLEHFHIFEGRPEKEKICAPCTLVWHEFSDAHEMSPTPGSLLGTLKECVCENDDDEDQWRPMLAGLLKRFRSSARGRRHLAGRIADKWEIAASRARYGVFPRPFVWPPAGGAA